jgi:hypothetical protein
VRVRACVCTRYYRCNWRFSAPSLIGLRIGLRRDCRHWWGDGVLLRVRVRVAVRAPACNGLRLWCFRLCFRLCFILSSVLRPRHNRAMRIALPQGTWHPTIASAAGEPAWRRRRAPQELLLLRAKTLESSLLLGSFLGLIFTICRPNFSHFHRAGNSGVRSQTAASHTGFKLGNRSCVARGSLSAGALSVAAAEPSLGGCGSRHRCRVLRATDRNCIASICRCRSMLSAAPTRR